MASIRIPFPEQDEPSVVALRGARITIGRLPFNTVQIIDRTVSGFHAELILEEGHYRLHDRGSTNGTFVNGEPATDFHLRDACRISFGTVECEFDPAAATPAHGETVPTRGEMNTVRQENAELRGLLAAAREEVAALLETKPVDDPAQAVAREEFTKVVAEREALKAAQLRDAQEIARLKTDVAVLRRDRDNLQRAWDETKAELAKVQRPIEAVAVMEVAAVPAAEKNAEVAAPPAPVPMPSAPAVPARVPSAPPISQPSPPPLSRPAMPVAKPVVPLAPPTGRPFPVPKPGAPTVKLVPVPIPAGQARPANSSGIRPLPKAVPAGQVARPVTGIHPRTAVMPVHAPAVGPKGTQKLG